MQKHSVLSHPLHYLDQELSLMFNSPSSGYATSRQSRTTPPKCALQTQPKTTAEVLRMQHICITKGNRFFRKNMYVSAGDFSGRILGKKKSMFFCFCMQNMLITRHITCTLLFPIFTAMIHLRLSNEEKGIARYEFGILRFYKVKIIIIIFFFIPWQKQTSRYM